MLSKELHEKFLDLANALSPENLTCDGELSKAAVRRRYSALMKEWKALEKLAGQKVTEDEVWATWAKSEGLGYALRMERF
jgi:hypothetical protein